MKTSYKLLYVKSVIFAWGAVAIALPLTLHGHDHGRALDPILSSVEDLRVKGSMGAEWGFSDGTKNSPGSQLGKSENYHSFNISHIRLGVEGSLFRDFEFDTVLSILPNGNMIHDLGGQGGGVNLYRATLTYTALDPVDLTFGHDRPRLGIEGATADEKLNTITRSVLTGSVRPALHTGLAAHGDWNIFDYHAGIYNSDAGGGANAPNVYPVSYLYNLSGGVDLDQFTSAVHDDFSADVRVDYIYNDEAGGFAGAGAPYKNALAVGADVGFAGVNVTGEYVWARAHDRLGLPVRPRVRGFMIKPAYFVTDHIEVVARYERLRNTEGSTIGGLLGHNAYAADVAGIAGGNAGNKYQAIYLGANCYMYDGYVKLMGGVEFAELRGDTAAANNFNSQAQTVLTAIRLKF